eukprot:4471925-Pleurochrysis_carterae.AAC.5
MIAKSFGVDTSSRTRCPGGITTESPSAGSGPPPHVVGDDHKSMYSNVAVTPVAATPLPATVSTTEPAAPPPPVTPCAPLSQVTAESVMLTIVHATPERKTPLVDASKEP